MVVTIIDENDQNEYKPIAGDVVSVLDDPYCCIDRCLCVVAKIPGTDNLFLQYIDSSAYDDIEFLSSGEARLVKSLTAEV